MNALLLTALLVFSAPDADFSEAGAGQVTKAYDDPAYVTLYEPKARLVVMLSEYGNPGDFGLNRRDVYTMDECLKMAQEYEEWDWGIDMPPDRFWIWWDAPVKHGWKVEASCWELPVEVTK